METTAQKELIEELKEEWRELWRQRIDDKVRAEGIANKDYSALFVEQGTVIVATRDYKPLDFREIFDRRRIFDLDRLVPPHPTVGGWRKFIRAVIADQGLHRRKTQFQPTLPLNRKQQLRKSGRGWLHF